MFLQGRDLFRQATNNLTPACAGDPLLEARIHGITRTYDDALRAQLAAETALRREVVAAEDACNTVTTLRTLMEGQVAVHHNLLEQITRMQLQLDSLKSSNNTSGSSFPTPESTTVLVDPVVVSTPPKNIIPMLVSTPVVPFPVY